MANLELSDSFWLRWYIYASWTAIIPVTLMFLFIGAFLRSEIFIQFPDVISEVLGTVGFVIVYLVGIMMAITGIWMLVGYYYDAKELKEKEADWAPTWWVWAISHILASPILLAPIYLLWRTARTGVPWKNGYQLRS